jgi:predicted chitinase
MSSISAAQIGLLAPKANPVYVTAFQNADAALADTGILASDLRLCHFMAQVLTETGDLHYTAEDLDYSAATICKVWPSHFATPADAAPYAHNSEALGNYIYGPNLNGKGLGNTEADDGFRFRGRGLLQTTGRAAYARVGQALGIDLIGNPDLAFDARYSLQVAGNVWVHNTYHGKGCNALADADDVTSVTRAINGGLNGLAARKDWLAKAKQVWRGAAVPAPAPAPVPASAGAT